jgi:5'-3' exonuclease
MVVTLRALLPALSFSTGRLFEPVEQLLAVLPSASCTC